MSPQLGYASLIAIIFPLLIASIKLCVGDDSIRLRCIESEKQALLSFKMGVEDTDGMLSSWENDEDCCNWRGVKCNNLTNHVIELDVHGSLDQHLSANYMSPSLVELSHLRYLDISKNYFTSIPIPDYVGSLVNLMYLNLSRSWFSGVIPPHLGNLTNLQTLDLNGLYLVHNPKSFEWLSPLSSLQYLDLSEINLENASDWIQVITNLPHLQTLVLSNCNLPPPIVPSLYINISTSLSKIDLSRNHISSSSIIFWLSNFSTTLVYLDLSHNNLQGYIPNAFENMTSLSYVDFGFNQLEGIAQESLWNFCNLRLLSFSGNELKVLVSDFLQILPECALNSLQHLDLSHNKFSGPFPSFSSFPTLKLLDLSHNEFNGTIHVNLGQLSYLETMYLDHNLVEGTIFEAHFLNLTKLRSMDMSHNSLSFHLRSDWIPPFQLDSIYLSSCKLGPKFPNWLRGQNYSYLDLSNTSISGIIPRWFWNFSPNLQLLNLSGNKMRGALPTLSINFTGNERINLGSNEFEGEIPSFLSGVEVLDVSNNKFSGLSFVCEIKIISPMDLLDASNNEFEELPNCWKSLSNLMFLNLANNGFSRQDIPNSMSNLKRLLSLHLRNNNLSGEFPSWLQNFTHLRALDLGGNHLKGEIPFWIGEKLSKLVVLSLRSNQFQGELPPTLCHLNSIHFLDLSLNKIVGAIPNCLHNLTDLTIALRNDGYTSLTAPRSDGMKEVDEEMTMTWKGRELLMDKTLLFLRSIDFSGNHLTGRIPIEIGKLVSLVALNLSRNHLMGEIPENIGQLKSLDFLDLSRNELMGHIPSSLSQINGLSVLDLSYNKLSGKIPTGTQLQSFNAEAYAGNLQLCGSPLPTCFDEEVVPNFVINNKQAADDNEFASRGFYISLAIGFIAGFWGICASLMFLRSWRHAYFGFLSFLNDWFYVKMAISKNKMQNLLDH